MSINFNKPEFIRSAADRSGFLRDGLPQFAFAGRSNVGKSSVINRLVNRKNMAYVGASPGKTTQINYFLIDQKAYLVDLPGYGYAKVSDSERRRWSELIEGYFDDDRDLRLVLQLWDIRHDPSKDDYQMLEYMLEREIPFIIVLTKADKLNKSERAKRLAAFDAILADLEGVTVIPFSATNGEGADEVRSIIEQVIGN